MTTTISNRTQLDAEITTGIADGRITRENYRAAGDELYARLDPDWFASRPIDGAWIAGMFIWEALDDAEMWSRPATQTTATPETCIDCGDARSLFCAMSADGEGPHRIARTLAATDADAAFMARHDIHAEQGAAER